MIVISRNAALTPVPAEFDAPVIGWHNLVTASNIAASSTAAGFPASNLGNPATTNGWKANASGEVFLTAALVEQESVEVDYFGIAEHNFGSASIPVSAEAFIDGDWDEIAPQAVTPDDAPLIYCFPRTAVDSIRIRLRQGSAAPEAKVLYIGRRLSFPRGFKVDTPHTPFPQGRKRRIYSGKSESGKMLGRIVLGEWAETKAVFEQLDYDWFRQNADPFLAAAGEAPFFFAWKPLGRPEASGFAELANDPAPLVDLATGRVGLELQMTGVAH